MKWTTLTFLLLLTASVQATNYYVSNSGSDANNGTSTSTPWQTISKVNSSTFAANDVIYFQRGGTFYGSIVVSRSNLTFSAYGSGANPIISGFTTISTGWTNYSGNIYQHSVSAAPATHALKMVLYNNKVMEMGRYPNPADSNGGYLDYSGWTGKTSITDNDMPTAIRNFAGSWNGSDVCVRKNNYTVERNITAVIDSTNKKIDFSPGTNINNYGTGATSTSALFNGVNGFGYFLQNNIKAVDRYGEWYYDSTAKNIYVAFSAAPNIINFRVSTIDVLLNINYKSFITVTDIDFTGANKFAILCLPKTDTLSQSTSINVTKCNFTNIGGRAVALLGAKRALVDSCSFNWCLSTGVQMYWYTSGLVGSNCAVTNCSFKNIAPYVGMASNIDNGDNNAIHANVIDTLLIEKNTFDSVGKAAVYWQGNKVVIRKNFITNAMLSFLEYGAIYTWVQQSGTTYTNREISNNIIGNCPGQSNGTVAITNTHLGGIYLDGVTMNVNLLDNSIFNMGGVGIQANNPVGIVATGNTLYNNLKGIVITRYKDMGINTLNIKFARNIVYSSKDENRAISYGNGELNDMPVNTIPADLASIGPIDSNYYGNYNPTPFAMDITQAGSYVKTSEMALTSWTALSTKDSHSVVINTPPLYKIDSLIGTNRYANGDFNSSPSVNAYSTGGTTITRYWDSSYKINGKYSIREEFATPVAGSYPGINTTVPGQLVKTKDYILRYSTLGTTNNGITKPSLNHPSTLAATPQQKHWFGKSRIDHEYLFSHPDSTSIDTNYFRLYFRTEGKSDTTYIDLVQFYEAAVTQYSINDRVKFLYNATSSSASQGVTLPLHVSSFSDVYGNNYTSSATVPAYNSVLLIANQASARPAPPRVATTSVKGDVQCYPNPARDVLNVVNLKAEDEWQTLSVMNLTGAKVLPGMFINQKTRATVNISKLPAGEYFVLLNRKKASPLVLQFIKL